MDNLPIFKNKDNSSKYDFMKILINHLGYERLGPKKAILECPGLDIPPDFQVFQADSGQLLASGTAESSGKVPHWRDWTFYEFDLSEAQVEGPAFLRVLVDDTSVDSEIFQIKDQLLVETTTHDVIQYFKANRCSDIYDAKDKETSFYGDSERAPVDLSGGWYDASGDLSKYLSHLSYANDMNPQQTPWVVWSLLESSEKLQLKDSDAQDKYQERLLMEGLYGADFLAKSVLDSGEMVMTVFDKWSKDPKQREACSYSTQMGHKHSNFQAAFRQGAGVSIAALAKASVKSSQIQDDEKSKRYLSQAKLAYQHLLNHNKDYLPNHQENIIDEYCALLASVELLKASQYFAHDDENEMMLEVERWAKRLISKQSMDSIYPGHFKFHSDSEKPFFHAAEAGLPYISLLKAAQVLTSPLKDEIYQSVYRGMIFELEISAENFNPFGYAKQYVQGESEAPRSSFFYPHDNPSGYWWQGENARIASLAAAAWKVIEDWSEFHIEDQTFIPNLRYYAHCQMNWILGLNPFDMCMLHGHGRNNPHYEKAYPPTAGGVCNGITGGFENELSIDFAPQSGAALEGDQKWRWGEQWIPHAAWYLMAITSQETHS